MADQKKENIATMRKTAEAHTRYIRISPRKMRLVTNLVKNMWALDAITQLKFTNKKGAAFAMDLIKSAIANAENNFKLKKEHLFIKSFTCDAGPKLKRYMPRAQGRATDIRRPTSHLHVMLEERAGSKPRKFKLELSKRKEQPKKAELPESKEEQAKDGKVNMPAREPVKTDEQRKLNKIQQKRRLFNRKSGT